MPTIYNVDHSPQVIAHGTLNAAPGESVDVDQETADSLLRGSQWSTDVKAAKAAAKAYAERLEAEAKALVADVEKLADKDAQAPAPADETKEVTA
jgi:hypothetical protein